MPQAISLAWLDREEVHTVLTLTSVRVKAIPSVCVFVEFHASVDIDQNGQCNGLYSVTHHIMYRNIRSL